MAPTPQELPVIDESAPNAAQAAGERVVISGMSGTFPSARHVGELSDILYNKVNPLEEQARWNYNHPEVPKHGGLIPNLDTFDAQFFRVHHYLGITMDPMSRKILEHAYQAIYDAGINPSQLSGKKIGVYVGTCLSETEKTVFYNGLITRTGLGIAGCNKSMFANRVSYWLNAKGPSLAIDAACCSSTAALEQAYQAMTRGACEAAVVAGCSLCLHPQTSIHLGRTIKLCKDGKTKSYDQSADGCVKSESVNILFLQKAKDALRIYADVVYVKTKFISTGGTGNFSRKPEQVVEFLKEFYDEVKVSPQEVEFVEGFGAADPESDKTELDAIDSVFCRSRSEPLNVGSVMSNVGYCESASGIMSVTKVLLGYHKGQLAGNLHCTQPRTDVAALRERRLYVLSDHASTDHGYVAVNGLSLTGVNSHVLLHGHYKPKDLTKYESSIPRLVLMSGRTDTAVQNMINTLKSRPIDAEELALLQNIHSTKVNGHLGRGFAILETDSESKTTALVEKAEYYDGGDRQLWFVYSGMGSQWAGMGAKLMRIPIFAAAIERCHRVLKPRGIDIVDIITSPDKTIFDNILHSFVGIAAVQIGLTDVLNELGLVPDKIIGHSVGELGCAYADGCLTAEEMILAAYSRGRVSVETPFIRGSMAAVGIGFEEVVDMCPPEIEVACHNSSDSSTISGPAEPMSEFVAQLTAKSIFAKEVPCSNIAYHSRYIAEAGPGLLKYLKEVIGTPKLRSERWVSTSVPQERWEEDSAKYSSAEYHTNNLLSPVLFEETSRLIPRGAVLVEVAPHGLLQAILKRSMPNCTHVPLTRRAHPDNARFMLEAVGQLFLEGYYPDIRVLYPKVEFPVSTGTPHLSPLVEWAHGEKWVLARYASPKRLSTATCTFKITLHDDEYSYLQGHRIEGKTLFPFASALVCAWDTLAMSANAPRRTLPVTFHDVAFQSQPVMHDSRLLDLTVELHRGSGRFQIHDGITQVVSGYVNVNDNKEVIGVNEDSKDSIKLKTDDIYQMLYERGYMYEDEFRSIREANESFTEGVVSWSGRWAPFLDSLLQLHALRQPHDGLSQPAFIRKINIATTLHMELPNEDLNAKICTLYDYTRCGGVVLNGVKFRHITKSEECPLVFDTSKFDPKYQVKKSVKSTEVSQNRKVLKSTRFGDLGSLHWAEAALPEDDGVSVKVHFAGLNATDISKSDGLSVNQHSGEGIYGMDFSGTTENGSRVMGVVAGGAASERVSVHPAQLWPVPAHWSLEDAATVPFPYALALYCLAIKTVLRARTRILVGGAAGATGQAIITLALHHNCRVFAVVGDVTKKRFLMKMFPQLNADDVICCRDDSFVSHVLSATNGKGCEYVVCGRGEQIDAYLECNTHLGITLDIHQLKTNEMFAFKMGGLAFERSYIRVEFSSLFLNNDIKTFKEIQTLLAEGISGGWVRPLSRVSYAPLDAVRAFRLLARSQHRGRTLLSMHHALPLGESRLRCSAGRCQLIVSDDDVLAVVLATRLVRRGAHSLHLHLRLTHTSTRFSLAVKSWRKMGVNVETSSGELAQLPSSLVKQCLRLGPVEGVYVVMTKHTETLEVYESLLANLDAETRKTCPFIKYFAVIGINNCVGKRICASRAAAQLPAMMLSVAIDTKTESATSTKSSANPSDIVNAMEQALLTKQPVVFAHHPVHAESLSQQIEKITGVTIAENAGNKTLQDLGLSIDKAQELCIFLRDKQNVTIPENEVPLLTIDKIQEMEVTLKESDYTPAQGLSQFFSFVDNDELLATVDTVVMPTLTQSSNMRDDEFDATVACLYIVPGLQGLHQRYRGLCERLQLAAMALQPGLDHARETLQETTARYVQMYLKKRAGLKSFYLLGHEMGVLSVLEIAAALEDHGMRGTVFCLGGGPDEFLQELEACVRAVCVPDSEQSLQVAVARHMCSLMGLASADLDATLEEALTWPEKVEASVLALKGRVAHSTQYARLLIEAAYARVKQAQEYTRERQTPRALESRVVLLRSPAPATAPASPTPHPLQRYSRQPLIVHELRAPLASAADDLRAAALINHYLDDDTKQSFAERSLCYSYLINRDTFIGTD